MDRARRIALKHSQQLVDYANAECDRVDAETDKRIAALEAKVVARKEQLARQKKYGKPVQSDAWYQNDSPAGECKGDGGSLSGPPPGSWAATARMMAQGDDSGFDWDRWKDEMKERDM